MSAVHIEYGGQVYEFDELDMTVDEAETVQKYVGRSLGDFANGLATCEVKSVVALWWLLRKRAGQNPGAIARPPDGFRPLALFAAYAAAVKAEADRAEAEAAQEPEPDPTQPPASPLSPEPAGTTTTPVSAPVTPSLPG